MNLDYDEMLKKLERKPKEIETIPFTQEKFEEVAGKMADLGYIHSKASLEALEAYMSGYGLLLIGDVGTGKTFFFETLIKALTPSDDFERSMWEFGGASPHIFYMRKTIGMAFDDIEEAVTDLNQRDVIFDDIGVEVVANDWGRKFELVPWLVDLRLNREPRSHFTTNLSADQILERYGARTVDRLHALVKVVEFRGESHRQTLPNSAAVDEYKKKVEREKQRQEEKKRMEELAAQRAKSKELYWGTDDIPF